LSISVRLIILFKMALLILQRLLNEVPDQVRWRTLTISASAFPASMSGVNRNSFSLVERNEWKAWRDMLHANRRRLSRLPTYSDCGIQHPAGVEGFDPRTMQASASVRYAIPEDWLLIKGEGTARAHRVSNFRLSKPPVNDSRNTSPESLCRM
jgi:hypothetical protein